MLNPKGSIIYLKDEIQKLLATKSSAIHKTDIEGWEIEWTLELEEKLQLLQELVYQKELLEEVRRNYEDDLR